MFKIIFSFFLFFNYAFSWDIHVFACGGTCNGGTFIMKMTPLCIMKH